MAILSFLNTELLLILYLAVVVLRGAYMEEVKPSDMGGVWTDDPKDAGNLSVVDRSKRQVTSLSLPQVNRIGTPENGTTTTTPPSATTSEVSSTPSSTMSSPPSDSTTSPFDTSTTTAPDTSPDPNDKCGTYFSSPRGMNDPGPCFPPNSSCSNPLCMKDFASDDLYSCLWSSSISSSRYSRSLFSNSTPPPPIVIEVPGNCQPNNIPPAFANSSDIPTPTCFFQQNATSSSRNLTKCVCTKWDGSCPDEDLKFCERDQLLVEANELIWKIMEISEMVQPGCPCDYELEQMLPLAIQALEEEKNLYRVNMLLYQARETHICNRRRLMTCQPDGTCGCAPGTAQREYHGGDIIIRSYYCYATQGNCDDDPAKLIKQFKRGEELVRRHYGDPMVPTHKDYESGCFINYCKNAADNIQNRIQYCST